jgi:glucose/mannose transport system substrate-binding protein
MLITLLLIAAVLVACGGDTAENTNTNENAAVENSNTAEETTEEPAEEEMDGSQVEVFSWWTGGGEAAGLEAMIEVFAAEYPEIEFINSAVAGGAGTNARAVLATRLQASDPPDSWQGHAGQELIGTYVAADQLEPLNFLYEQEGWLDVMPETLIPLISDGGNIYSVPVNIHRANVLWINPTVLSDNGLEVPTSLEEWFAAMDTLQEGGMDAPLALGEQWTVMHLFETIMLASLGPEAYNGLWDGSTDWGSAEAKAGLDNFAQALTYANTDASALTWQDAAQLVIDGDAAFNVMGDWAEGFFREIGMEPRVDYDWAPVPGTAGTFQFLSDSFVLAVGAPNRDAALAWLTVAGSQAGQDAFNPVKGSIPARTDGDRSLYGEYLLSAMDDWTSNTVVGSLAHGVVANDSWKSEIDTSLGLFLTDSDVDNLQAGLVAAYESAGATQTAIEGGGETAAGSDQGGTIEVFSWWTGGGEAAGLEAMVEVFGAAYPNIEFVNAAVAGGAGTNARAVLATRLQAGDPPGSWQGHAGQELIGTYVAADQLEPLNFLYEEQGWLAVMPETLIPLISQDGNIYSVPVNIHRANVMWHNPAILSENGVEVPASLEEWFGAMDTLVEGGMDAPLAMGEQWTAMHLMETVLLSSLGPEAYNGLWDGSTDWGSAEVTTALENFDHALSYTNSDASALTWQDAARLVVDGDAAFNVMGDWAEGYFREINMEPNVDYGWSAVPGSDGVFQFLSDSFVLPVGAPDREATIAWLTIAGSLEGQDAFNPVKGSIPARTDGDRSLYGEYLLSAMDDWSSDIVVGSLTHGVVANDSWKSEIDTALGLFLGTRDVGAFQEALVAAFESTGP